MESELLQYIRSDPTRRDLITVKNAEKFTLIGKVIDDLFIYNNSQEFSKKLDLLLRYSAKLSEELKQKIAEYKQQERMVRLAGEIDMQDLDSQFEDLFGGDVNLLITSLSRSGLKYPRKGPSKRRRLE